MPSASSSVWLQEKRLQVRVRSGARRCWNTCWTGDSEREILVYVLICSETRYSCNRIPIPGNVDPLFQIEEQSCFLRNSKEQT